MRRWIYVFAVILLVTAIFFGLTYAETSGEFTAFDLLAVSLSIIVVALLQSLVAALIGSAVFRRLVLAFFLLFNMYAVNIMFVEAISQMSVIAQLGIGSVLFFALYSMMDFFFNQSRRSQMVILTFGVAVLAVIVALPFATSRMAAAGKESGDDVTAAKFVRTPNVYVISYDSMIPRVLYRNLFEADGAPFHNLLESKFNRYTNMFGDGRGTVQSLNSFLAMSPEYFDLVKADPRVIITGRFPSPFIKAFERNGYETTTFLGWDSWGPAGSNVNHYRPNRGPTMACGFVEGPQKPIAFLGLCSLIELEQVRKLMGPRTNQSQHTYNMVTESSARSAPQLVFGHIYAPGHSPASYNAKTAHTDGTFEDFRDVYYSRGRNATKSLSAIIDFLEENDPNAVLFIFGDHGPALSRGLDYEDAPEFFFHDKYGIFGGYLKSGSCSAMPAASDRVYSTLQQVAHDIVGCLTVDDEAVERPSSSEAPQRLSPLGFDVRYADHLYE